MSFIDGLLITLVNTVVCITFPAVLAAITSKKQAHKPAAAKVKSRKPEISGAMDAV
jgi:hypothetical protein